MLTLVCFITGPCRSHSAPVRREVKVQLLDAGRPQSSEPNLPKVQPNTAFSSQDAGAASTAAAITAAAIAATAPLIKVRMLSLLMPPILHSYQNKRIRLNIVPR